MLRPCRGSRMSIGVAYVRSSTLSALRLQSGSHTISRYTCTQEALPDMRRTLFEPEHDQFRESFRRWVRQEITPHLEEWDAAGIVPRGLFQSAGHHGFLGLSVPVDYGGARIDDFRFNAVIEAEISIAGAHAAGVRTNH